MVIPNNIHVVFNIEVTYLTLTHMLFKVSHQLE